VDRPAALTRNAARLARTLVLAVVSALVFFPLYMAIVVALKDGSEMSAGILSLPKMLHWDNFVTAARMTNYFATFRNSFVITVSSVILTVLTNSFVAYAIQRNWTSRFFRGLYYYFLSAMFIPFSLIMLPIVRQMSVLGGTNPAGLILLYVAYGLPFNTFVFVGYLRTIAAEIEEAASIDGAGTWSVFFRIIFPLMAPINATVAILTTLWVWNDFLLPLIIIKDSQSYTLPLMQYVFQDQYNRDYNLSFASYILVLLPMVVVYAFLQRRIISGVMSGSIKG
jgi:raffinose/stachyose/melibiose transport system permease protein